MNVKNILLIFMCSVICFSCSNEQLTVTVKNTTSETRHFENVEVKWSEIIMKIPNITSESLVVSVDGEEQDYQVIYNKLKEPETVLIQASVNPNAVQEFIFTLGTPRMINPLAFGRFVPERKDDFAWENNKVAYRVYGPALEEAGELSNGIDIWAKRTENLIIDKWYKSGDYHTDHGEGMDYYKVGRTLGAGAIAPIFEDSLVLGSNFIDYEVLENGPLRTTFKLNYAPLKVGDKIVNESRTISLSANSHFTKIVQMFEGDFVSIDCASGIVLRQDMGSTFINEKLGIITYQEPEMGNKGQLFVTSILVDAFEGAKESQGHLLALTSMKNKTPLTYYIGNGWSKAEFKDVKEWNVYSEAYANSIIEPLEVECD